MGVGLSTGLSLGIVRRLGLDARVAEVSCQVVATLFFCLLIYYLTVGSGSLAGPNPTLQPPQIWLLTSFAGLFGIVLGLELGAQVLIPGFVAFAETASYFEEIFWPYVGFAAGYFVLILAFAVGYNAVYNVQRPHQCSPTTPSSYTATYGADLKLCELTFNDFAFFSMNTIAPLGYSDLRPKSAELKFATSIELALGIFWTVIVFAGIVVQVTDRHTSKIVTDALKPPWGPWGAIEVGRNE